MPVIVAVPGTALVKVALYVPSPLSVTAPTEPMSLERTTASPPAVRPVPAASSRATVIVELPPNAIEAGEALIVDVAADATLTRPTTTVAVLATGTPSRVPLIVTVPTTSVVKVAL